ncbi:MBL fold metallo-hydrolase [Candidatus Pelagibacter sp.]|nr:MBL fold metallo-hydrolase [Candidatus Pelagibacter sp.]
MIFEQLFDNRSSTYTYIIGSRPEAEGLIIDPVLDNVNQYIEVLNKYKLQLVKVIDTHIHADHISGASELKDKTNCTTIMGQHTPSDVVEIKVKDNELINVEGFKLKAIYTPGHTSDSYSFLMDDKVFTGDTLLINGTGRTDFQNGSAEDSYRSIFERLLKLPENTLLYPAHDYNGKKFSNIGNEKKFNPRLQVKNVDEYKEIMNNLNLKKPHLMDTNVSRNINLGAS